MTIEFEAPESMAGGGDKNYVKKAGKYHMIVTDVDEAPRGAVGGFRLECIVKSAEEANADQVNLACGITFFGNKADSKDNNEFNKRKWTRAAVAVGWMSPAEAVPNAKIRIEDPSSAKNRNILVEIEPVKDGQFMNLVFDRIYHIDDPNASKAHGFPRNDQVLAIVPESHRRKPEEFTIEKAKEDGGGGAAGGGETKLTAADLDNL